ncbi:hypothetical protein [Massilia psychrophila]|uniref:Uncharacterized protein n=1 Tax=Massilia psychrophila TaxID=1603353 RepID=A0A2G8SYK3_9BURK|nr:hypothetical protein [Massilia psychrophila]PIL38877.1 hypothetical protein CR103_15730 [Massilia psychrophila]GGE91844.1 hypothetical protein GCM10008020_41050 [Massilia psychrophila]
MKTQLKLATLAALTAATLALPAAGQNTTTAPAKCAPNAMMKCGAKCAPKCHAKKHTVKKAAKCGASNCAPKRGPKCGPKCTPKN